jgi:hypothetical protein
VIGEEVLGLRDPKVIHPGSDHPDKSPPNLRLNIAVVPGVSGKYGWPQSAKCFKKEVRISKEGESR